jgi:hypothetical protein
MTLFAAEPVVRSTDYIVEPYRYWLSREWEPELGRVCWGMLNPSKATKYETDPTDTRVRNFTRDWGYGAYTIVNIGALQATDPTELAHADDPCGPENDTHFREAVERADLVIAAWGASYPKRLAGTVQQKAAWLKANGAHVLGLTKGGDPRHPLYMLGASRPLLWSEVA